MRRVGFLLLAAAAVFSGCSEGAADGDGGAETGVAGAVAEFRRMADDPLLYRDRWVSFNAHVEECMRSQGFKFTPAPVPSGFAEAVRFPGYDLVTMPAEEARESGFSFSLVPTWIDPEAIGPFEAPDIDGNPSVVSSKEFAWSRAMMGLGGGEDDHDDGHVEDGGCYSAAVRDVGPLSFAETVLMFDQAEEIERYARMVSDARAWEVARSWEECMAARGHGSVGDPFNTVATTTFFWTQLVPQRLGLEVERSEYWELPEEQRRQIDELHLLLAEEYVECAIPLRDDLKGLWSEFLGFVP